MIGIVASVLHGIVTIALIVIVFNIQKRLDNLEKDNKKDN